LASIKKNRAVISQRRAGESVDRRLFFAVASERFEGPPSVVGAARANWRPYLSLRAEPREKSIDEKNGYMSCGGDGAQASFDVALFLLSRWAAVACALSGRRARSGRGAFRFTHTYPSLN